MIISSDNDYNWTVMEDESSFLFDNTIVLFNHTVKKNERKKSRKRGEPLFQFYVQ